MGSAVGIDGSAVGSDVGTRVGRREGFLVGAVGRGEGRRVGCEGIAVGVNVGTVNFVYEPVYHIGPSAVVHSSVGMTIPLIEYTTKFPSF